MTCTRFLCLVAWSVSLANAGPALSFISFLGASDQEILAHDAAGDLYVGGNVISNAIAATPGAFATSYHGGLCQRGLAPPGPCSDVIVAKWDPTGMRLLWVTYVGGTGDDFLHGMTVDAAGNVYLTGATSSTDFPVTAGAVQARYNLTIPVSGYSVLGDAFVVKLSASGSTLLVGTYLGGASSDSASGITVDSAGNIYVSGATYSTDFPVTAGALQTVNHAYSATSPGPNAFISKLNPAGTALIYSTYLGGSNSDDAIQLAVDPAGAAYVAGNTHSPDFPVTSSGSGGDVFLTRLNATGTALLSSTTLGGRGTEELSAMAVDSSGRVYLAGSTTSPSFPVTPNALQTSHSPGVCVLTGQGTPLYCPEGFVARFDPSGVTLEYATYLGGSAGDRIASIAVDSQGYVSIAGDTNSMDFPITTDAFQSCSRSSEYGSAFVARFLPGSPLAYSTFLGGAGGSSISSLFADGLGHVYFTGTLYEAGVPIPGTGIEIPIADFPPAPVPVSEPGAGASGGTFVGMLDWNSATPPGRISCIVNGASRRGDYLSPGEIVEIQGQELGPQVAMSGQLTPNGTLATSLGGVQVFFSGIPAPLISVQAERIGAIVPDSLPLWLPAEVRVQNSGGITPVFPNALTAATPGVFTQDGSGHGPGAILNQDGTVNTPANPAARGSVVSIFCTGLGGKGNDGSINSSTPPAAGGTVAVSIGGYSGEVLYAGGAPGEVFGVYQVNVRVPEQAPAGAADTVTLIMDSAPSFYVPIGSPVPTISVQGAALHRTPKPL